MLDSWDDYINDCTDDMFSSFYKIKEEAAELRKTIPELSKGHAVHIIAFKKFKNIAKNIDISKQCRLKDENIEVFLDEIRKVIVKQYR